jgi:restriction system protein
MNRKKKSELIDSLTSLIVVVAFFIGVKVWGNTQNFKTGFIAFAEVLIGVMAVSIVGLILYRKFRNNRLLASGIDTIDRMSGETFEKFLLQHFNKQGYTGELTSSTADYGADLILKKDGRKIVVQAKRWKQLVGIESVQQVAAAIKHYDADKGMVIINGVFTENAYNLARSNGIELWDRKKLIEFMTKTGGKELAVIMSSQNNTETVSGVAFEDGNNS